jgi:D-sedoheptulose 7-phosphate isomerase
MQEWITVVASALIESQKALNDLLSNIETQGTIVEAGNVLSTGLAAGSRVFSCGNGGSMCDAIHFAEELSGRYRDDRAGLPATAIADPGHLSCVGNDYGYEYVFSRYLQAHARKGDILLAITTSGKSANVIEAAKYARSIGMVVIGLTGRLESPVAELLDLEICTPAGKYADRVQELHIKVIHILIELVERSLYPENYTSVEAQ